VLRLALVAAGVLVMSWALIVALAARLPEGTLKELASFLPDCVTTVRRLRRDPRVPRRAKVAVAFAGLWVLSPIDLIPEFLPVIGPLDDVVVVALALRYAARRVPPEVLFEAWPGRRSVTERLLGTSRAGGVRAPKAPSSDPQVREDR
jgi:uncharacterized membrane protein YkvA (DUF1232 family)